MLRNEKKSANRFGDTPLLLVHCWCDSQNTTNRTNISRLIEHFDLHNLLLLFSIFAMLCCVFPFRGWFLFLFIFLFDQIAWWMSFTFFSLFPSVSFILAVWFFLGFFFFFSTFIQSSFEPTLFISVNNLLSNWKQWATCRNAVGVRSMDYYKFPLNRLNRRSNMATIFQKSSEHAIVDISLKVSMHW